VLTNLKLKESAIVQFPSDSTSKPDNATFDLLNKIPFCFAPKDLFLGIQGKEEC
jgi:hypothetical protein